jgi:glycosyltransferase involved in cell wall biosynthesis
VDRVVFVSEAMRSKFVALYPDQREKTRVVHCGKDLDVFRPAARTFAGRIGMLCQIVPIKRIYEVVLALHELRSKGYPLSLHVGGEPRGGHDYQRYDASLRRAVEKLSLEDHVVFHGWVDDVVAWLHTIDLFVSNSYWEGQQNALLEAMATGCYCLSHFWDGAEEILPGEYLFATDGELRRKVAAYCELPDSAKYRHQSEYRSILEARFDLRRTTARMREIIEEVAGGARR